MFQATRWFAEAASRGYAPTVSDPKYPTPKSLPAPEIDESVENDPAPTTETGITGSGDKDPVTSKEQAPAAGPDTALQADYLTAAEGSSENKKPLRAVKLPTKQNEESKV